MRVGTVFSGIGSIEHALQTIGLPHEIIFACDNGDVNPFDLKIKKSFGSIYEAYLKVLESYKGVNLDEFHDNNTIDLNLQKKEIKSNIELLINKSLLMKDKILENRDICNLVSSIKQKELTPNLKKEWEFSKEKNLLTIEFLETYLKRNQKQVIGFKNKKKFINDLKDSLLYKEINKLMNKIILELNMINERIKSEEIFHELSKNISFERKKEIVDELYKSSNKKNYVYESYIENYNIEKENFHQDIRFLDGSYYKGKIDLFVGGSPCQSFSMVGKRRGLEDTRGTLFYEYARLIKEIKPKVFIYENVKGLLNHDKGETWKTMQQVFDDLGYVWSAEVMNSRDYGIPQNRERIFVVGFRKDIQLKEDFSFPEKIELKSRMQDFLSENVSGKYYLNNKGVNFVTSKKNIDKRYTQINGDIQLCQKANQQFNWHGDFVFEEESPKSTKVIEDLEKYFLSQKVEKYVMSSGTKGFYSKPEIDLEVARPLLTTMHKMHRAGVDNYVTTEGRIRKLTPRETLRLMGYCDTFKIVVSDTQMYRQAGNSIVVNVMIHLLQNICISLPELIKVPREKHTTTIN